LSIKVGCGGWLRKEEEQGHSFFFCVPTFFASGLRASKNSFSLMIKGSTLTIHLVVCPEIPWVVHLKAWFGRKGSCVAAHAREDAWHQKPSIMYLLRDTALGGIAKAELW